MNTAAFVLTFHYSTRILSQANDLMDMFCCPFGFDHSSLGTAISLATHTLTCMYITLSALHDLPFADLQLTFQTASMWKKKSCIERDVGRWTPLGCNVESRVAVSFKSPDDVVGTMKNMHLWIYSVSFKGNSETSSPDVKREKHYLLVHSIHFLKISDFSFFFSTDSVLL